MKNTFYFILKDLFVLNNVSVFLRTFRLCRKNGLIRKIRLTSKFMMSRPGLQTILIHISLNISQSRGNQTMKFGQLIEYNKRNIFLQKLWGKWGRETSFRPLFYFLKKRNMKSKQVICSLVSIYFYSPQLVIK